MTAVRKGQLHYPPKLAGPKRGKKQKANQGTNKKTKEEPGQDGHLGESGGWALRTRLREKLKKLDARPRELTISR